MRAIALALACMLPSVAYADVDGFEHCSVDYVTVPERVKEVIEGWVAAEPHCRGTIALRVIPTKDGYFLFAERPDGTVHERLVPDLTAAGVLVASWVADSWRAERPRKKKKKKRAMTMRAVAIDERTELSATVMPEPTPERKRWIALGGTLVAGAPGADLGFRLETDLIVYGPWKIGVAAQKVQDTMRVYTNDGMTMGQIDDWSAGALVSHTARWRGWELRGAAGIFVLGSHLHTDDFYTGGYDPPVSTYEIDTSPAYELSVTLARDLGDRWGLALTSATTFISQDWHGNDNMTWNHETTVTRKEVQPVWTVSLRRRI